MTRRMLALSLIGVALLLGCGREEVRDPETPPTPGVTEQERELFMERTEARLDSLQARVDAMRSMAELETGTVRTELEQMLVALDERRQFVEDRMNDLRGADDQDFVRMRPQVEASVEEYEQAIEDATAPMDVEGS